MIELITPGIILSYVDRTFMGCLIYLYCYAFFFLLKYERVAYECENVLNLAKKKKRSEVTLNIVQVHIKLNISNSKIYTSDRMEFFFPPYIFFCVCVCSFSFPSSIP